MAETAIHSSKILAESEGKFTTENENKLQRELSEIFEVDASLILLKLQRDSDGSSKDISYSISFPSGGVIAIITLLGIADEKNTKQTVIAGKIPNPHYYIGQNKPEIPDKSEIPGKSEIPDKPDMPFAEESPPITEKPIMESVDEAKKLPVADSKPVTDDKSVTDDKPVGEKVPESEESNSNDVNIATPDIVAEPDSNSGYQYYSYGNDEYIKYDDRKIIEGYDDEEIDGFNYPYDLD